MSGSWEDDMQRLEEARAEVGAALRDEFDRSLLARFRDDAVTAGERALMDEGGQPGSSIHSWRCEYPDRYGPCDCAREVARSLVDAVEPIIRADERERMADLTRKVQGGGIPDYEAEVRERIAQEIEDERDHFCRHTRTDSEHPLARAFARSARIARGQP